MLFSSLILIMICMSRCEIFQARIGTTEKQIYRLLHNLYHKAGLEKKNRNGGYELRPHSLRKYFKTQLKPRGLDTDYVDYMMGHQVDTYHNIQSKGIEFLRGLYARADLRIRSESGGSNVALFKKMVKEMTRELNVDPDEALAREALAEAHRSTQRPSIETS